MGFKLKFTLPTGWRQVKGWQNALDTGPDDGSPNFRPRNAVLLHKPANRAMLFMVPLRLPGFIKDLDLLGVIAKSNLGQGNLVSPIQESEDGGEFTFVTPDGMSCGKVMIRQMESDQTVSVVIIGLWPSEDEDGQLAEFDRIAGSVRTA